jgi:death-on-curing protein
MTEIDRLSEDEVLAVRRRMALLEIATQDAFGRTEPKDIGLLGSAVYRQYTSAGGVYKYQTIEAVAANLFFGIAMGHAFENGNKRTALMAMLSLFEKNRFYLINTTEDDLYELAKSLAANELPLARGVNRSVDNETQAISLWLKPRLRAKKFGDVAMQFKDLKDQLELLGCTFDKQDRNYIKIHRDQWMVRTGYPRANFEVPVTEVKKIRRTLRLDEAQGIDSGVFYNLEQTVDRFVNEYRDLMRRLADL